MRVWRVQAWRRPMLASSQIRFYSVPDQLDKPSARPVKQSEYIPQATYQRVSYEYPEPPKEPKFKPVESSPIRRHIPLLAALGGILWTVYAYKHFMSDKKSGDQNVLSPEHFVTYKLTFKEDVSSDIALLELSPKYDTHRELIRKSGGLWNGRKIWSVEIKQPEIQVVRRYTPLPMYYMQSKEGQETKGLLRLLGKDQDEGRMVLMVKRYSDGEVSRYLHRLPVGSDVEIRGPFVGYKFPYTPIDMTEPRSPMEDLPSRMEPEYDHPDGIPLPENIAFFAGGTGIAGILQSLFSVNPPRGRVDVFYSVRSRDEIPFKRFILFLEKAGRAKFHYFIDRENHFITTGDIREPVAKNYSHNADPEADKQVAHEIKVRKIMEELRKEKESGNFKETISSDPIRRPQVAAAKQATSEKRQKANPKLKYRSILEQVANNPPSAKGDHSIAVVCGPSGYLSFVSGPPGPKMDAPIGGLLGQKGWDTSNTFRMEP
jgi:NAD(P)H-flavin reductase